MYPIDLMDQTQRLVHVSIKKGANKNVTYDPTDHLIVDLKTITTLVSVTYIVDLNAYELHL